MTTPSDTPADPAHQPMTALARSEDNRPSAKGDRTDDEIKRFIRANPTMSIRDVADALGVGRDRVHRLKKLVEAEDAAKGAEQANHAF